MNSKFKEMRLFKQFIIIMMIIILIPTIFVSLGSYFTSSTEIKTIAIDLMEEKVNNIVFEMDEVVSEMAALSLQLSNDLMVRAFIEQRPEDYSGKYDFVSYMNGAGAISNITKSTSVISGIGFYGDSGAKHTIDYRIDKNDLDLLDDIIIEERKNQFENVLHENGSLKLLIDNLKTGSDEIYISFARRIFSSKKLVTAGTVVIDIEANNLKEMWTHKKTENQLIWIVNHEGVILYHSDENNIGDNIDEYLLTERFTKDDGSLSMTYDGEPTLFTYESSDLSGWMVVTALPMSVLEEPILKIWRTIIVYGLVAFLLSIFVGYFFINSITSSLNRLNSHLKVTAKGERSEITGYIPKNEIGELMAGYNSMNDKINNLIELVYNTEVKERNAQLSRQKAEFQALQMQINPHFLYNTLSAVSTYAIESEQIQIEEMVNALSLMLRYAVQNPYEYVELQEEIDHVTNFIIIQKYRNKIPIKVEYNLKGYESRKVLRLILQPIVENVYKYAFPSGVTSNSLIQISAYEEANRFIIEVKDNGVGYRYYEKGLGKSINEKGIGLKNVDKRIKIVYGNEHGIQLSEDNGTLIKIVMPKHIEEEMINL